jgi:hypothetical protein
MRRNQHKCIHSCPILWLCIISFHDVTVQRIVLVSTNKTTPFSPHPVLPHFILPTARSARTPLLSASTPSYITNCASDSWHDQLTHAPARSLLQFFVFSRGNSTIYSTDGHCPSLKEELSPFSASPATHPSIRARSPHVARRRRATTYNTYSGPVHQDTTASHPIYLSPHPLDKISHLHHARYTAPPRLAKCHNA